MKTVGGILHLAYDAGDARDAAVMAGNLAAFRAAYAAGLLFALGEHEAGEHTVSLSTGLREAASRLGTGYGSDAVAVEAGIAASHLAVWLAAVDTLCDVDDLPCRPDVALALEEARGAAAAAYDFAFGGYPARLAAYPTTPKPTGLE